MNVDPIPYESRSLLFLRHRREERQFLKVAQAIAREVGMTTGAVVGAKLPGDPVVLRGIPAIGFGVAGVIRGTSPGWALE